MQNKCLMYWSRLGVTSSSLGGVSGWVKIF
jgi:hypothetical protein